jgi:hypothetical protein
MTASMHLMGRLSFTMHSTTDHVREMGGYVGRWVATCYTSSLGSNPDFSQKYKMDDILKGVANTLLHTLARQKIYKNLQFRGFLGKI